MKMSTQIQELPELDVEVAEKQENIIVLFNDEVNTFDHVIDMLVEACDHTPIQAEQCSLIVHYKGIDRASGALWPGYRNNTAALNLNLNANLTSRFSVWASEHSQAYDGSGYAVVEELDYPLFGFCGTQIDTGYWIFPSFSTSRIGLRSYAAEEKFALLSVSTSSDFASKVGDRRLKFNSGRLLHPWALACYGLSTDMLGWGQINALAEGGSASFHVMTIYDSNDVLPRGSTIKVALSQSPGLIPYPTLANNGADIEETQWGGDMNAMPPFDSYQLFVVAK